MWNSFVLCINFIREELSEQDVMKTIFCNDNINC